jgi:hypothetical protein
MERQMSLIAAILHLREASNELKDIYPDLSYELFSIGVTLMETNKIGEDSVTKIKTLAKSIREDSPC